MSFNYFKNVKIILKSYIVQKQAIRVVGWQVILSSRRETEEKAWVAHWWPQRWKRVVIRCHHGPVISFGSDRVKEGKPSGNTLCSPKSHLRDLRCCCSCLNPHPQERFLCTSPWVWDHQDPWRLTKLWTPASRQRNLEEFGWYADIVMNWEYTEQDTCEKFIWPKTLRTFHLDQRIKALGGNIPPLIGSR